MREGELHEDRSVMPQKIKKLKYNTTAQYCNGFPLREPLNCFTFNHQALSLLAFCNTSATESEYCSTATPVATNL